MLEALRAAPDTVAEWIPSTYGHLLHASRSLATAATFVRKVLATEEGRKANLLAGFARMILNFRRSQLCDLNLALELAEEDNDLSNSTNPHTLSTLATIRAELDDVVGAINAIELAIRHAADEDKRAAFVKKLDDLGKRPRDR